MSAQDDLQSFIQAQSAHPTWTHRGCGGQISHEPGSQDFTCLRCRRNGEMQIPTPTKHLSDEELLEYFKSVTEVDLTPVPGSS
jgi:hypothetical protein